MFDQIFGSVRVTYSGRPYFSFAEIIPRTSSRLSAIQNESVENTGKTWVIDPAA